MFRRVPLVVIAAALAIFGAMSALAAGGQSPSLASTALGPIPQRCPAGGPADCLGGLSLHTPAFLTESYLGGLVLSPHLVRTGQQVTGTISAPPPLTTPCYGAPHCVYGYDWSGLSAIGPQVTPCLTDYSATICTVTARSASPIPVPGQNNWQTVGVRISGVPGAATDNDYFYVTSTPAISGTVHDGAGRPLVGATVLISGPGGSVSASVDAKTGFYYALNLSPDTYTVTAADAQGTPLAATACSGQRGGGTCTDTIDQQDGTADFQAASDQALVFHVQPSNTDVGAIMTPAVQVAIVDRFGNTVTSATDTIALTLGANQSGATLHGNLSVAAVGGVASFPVLSLDKTGQKFTLVANDTSATATPATSGPFDVGCFAGSGAVCVTSVYQATGPWKGGVTVTVTGAGFTHNGAPAVTQVAFLPQGGGTPLLGSQVTVAGDTSLTVVAPNALPPGASVSTGNVKLLTDVLVTANGQQSATGAADQYTYEPPRIDAIVSAVSGTADVPLAGGVAVTLKGAYFTGVQYVEVVLPLRDAKVLSIARGEFTVDSDSQISIAAALLPNEVDVVRPPYQSSYPAAVTADLLGLGPFGGPRSNTVTLNYHLPRIDAITPGDLRIDGVGPIVIRGAYFTGAKYLFLYDSFDSAPSCIDDLRSHCGDFTVKNDGEIDGPGMPDLLFELRTELKEGNTLSASYAAKVAILPMYSSPKPPIEQLPAEVMGQVTYHLPRIDSVAPGSMQLDGQLPVAIHGAYFTGAAYLRFGGYPFFLRTIAFNGQIDGGPYTVISDTEIDGVGLPNVISDLSARLKIGDALPSSNIAGFVALPFLPAATSEIAQFPASIVGHVTYQMPRIDSMTVTGIPSHSGQAVAPLAGGVALVLRGKYFSGAESVSIDIPGYGHQVLGADKFTIVNDGEIDIASLPSILPLLSGKPANDAYGAVVSLSFFSPAEAALYRAPWGNSIELLYVRPRITGTQPAVVPLSGGTTLKIAGAFFNGVQFVDIAFPKAIPAGSGALLSAAQFTISPDGTELDVVLPDLRSLKLPAGVLGACQANVTLRFSALNSLPTSNTVHVTFSLPGTCRGAPTPFG